MKNIQGPDYLAKKTMERVIGVALLEDLKDERYQALEKMLGKTPELEAPPELRAMAKFLVTNRTPEFSNYPDKVKKGWPFFLEQCRNVTCSVAAKTSPEKISLCKLKRLAKIGQWRREMLGDLQGSRDCNYGDYLRNYGMLRNVACWVCDPRIADFTSGKLVPEYETENLSEECIWRNFSSLALAIRRNFIDVPDKEAFLIHCFQFFGSSTSDREWAIRVADLHRKIADALGFLDVEDETREETHKRPEDYICRCLARLKPETLLAIGEHWDDAEEAVGLARLEFTPGPNGSRNMRYQQGVAYSIEPGEIEADAVRFRDSEDPVVRYGLYTHHDGLVPNPTYFFGPDVHPFVVHIGEFQRPEVPTLKECYTHLKG